MSLYNLKALPDKFIITKFDDDLNPQASYQLSEGVCTCPAGIHDRYCRHKEMRELFEERGRVNSGWLLQYPEHKWWYFDPNTATLSEERKLSWRRL